MKPLERLRQQKQAAVNRMAELNALATRESRDLNDAEKAEYEQQKAAAETLTAKIEAVEEALAAQATPETAADPEPQPATVNIEELRSQVRRDEQLRQSTIRERVKAARLSAEFAETLVNENLTPEAASARIFAELARADQEQPHINPHHAAVTRDAAATMRDGMVNAMLHRHDMSAFKLNDNGKRFIDASLYDMAKQCLSARGVQYQGESKMRVAELALTTSDFPLIAGSVVNTTLRRAYEAAPRTYQLFSRRTTASDFRNINSLTLGENPQLELVNEHGEFKYGKVVEGREQYALKTYGKIIAFTRQMIINDNLGAITRVANDWGVAAATLESGIVWGIITSNPNMSDGVALFHANHGNLITGAGSALAVAGLGAGVATMATLKGTDGVTYINAAAKYLLVPAALQLSAAQLLGSSFVPTASTNAVPDYLRSLTPISDPRLDANSTQAWYLVADPMQIPTIEYAYLDGNDGVYTETRVGFSIDAIEYKARLDFGAKAIDYKGMQKNAGS